MLSVRLDEAIYSIPSRARQVAPVAGQSSWTVFAGALAPWAIPAIAVGIAIAYGARKAAAKQQAQEYEALLTEAKNKLQLDCKRLERELGHQVDQYVEQVWQHTEQHIESEGKKLEQLIAQTNPAELDADINQLSAEDARLTAIQQRLAHLFT